MDATLRKANASADQRDFGGQMLVWTQRSQTS